MGARLVQCACFCACLLSLLGASQAHAQNARLVTRASVDVATMLSRNQLGRLGFDTMGFLGNVQLGYEVWRLLDLQGGLTGGAFKNSRPLREAGGLVVPTVGALLHGPRDGLSPYVFAEGGPGITGTLVRPYFRVGAGLDIPVTRRLAFGPEAGYSQLVQFDEPGSSTDARFVWAGLALLYRHRDFTPPPEPKERVVVVHHTRTTPPIVIEREPPTPELMELLDQALPAPAPSRVELLAPVLFEYDSDELEPVGVAMLHEVSAELKARPDILLISIQGYADSRGSEEYNQTLSLKRAERVREWLIAHGIASERLTVEAEGATKLVEPGSSEPEHQQNRRVVFRVLKTAEP